VPAAALSSLLAAASLVWAVDAAAEEDPGAFVPGLFPLNGLDQPVQIALEADVGFGRGLFVGGGFTRAGAAAANRIAYYDGVRFLPLGEGLSGGEFPVASALAEFDDGTGPALYVGGRFDRAGRVEARNVARWNGSRWSPVGDGLEPAVTDLAVFDDGSGPSLFAAGALRDESGEVARGVLRWSGTEWLPHSEGFSAFDLEVFDDGSGAALFAAAVVGAGGPSPRHAVVRCMAGAFSIVGDAFDGAVRGLAVFDDGGGAALVAAGAFTSAGSAPVSRVARFDGNSWSGLGSGLDGEANAVAAASDGRGPALFVGGAFRSAGGAPAAHAARWDGRAWSRLGAGLDAGQGPWVLAIAGFDGGSGPSVYFGGGFEIAGGARVRGLARFDGESFSAAIDAPDGAVRAFAVHDDGTGPALYVGGEFVRAGRTVLNGVARWTGRRFEPVGNGVAGTVFALAVHDDGAGPRLYAGGDFAIDPSSGVPKVNVAVWDGLSWAPVFGGTDGRVRALASLGGPASPALYAGGEFRSAGGVATGPLAVLGRFGWWRAAGELRGSVFALATWDDGTGPGLVVGGPFADGRLPFARNLARLASDRLETIPGLEFGNVRALHAIADPALGSGVVVGGALKLQGGDGALRRTALFDGSALVPLGTGIGVEDGFVTCLAEMSDVSGPALFAGGFFRWVEGVESGSIARYDGTRWSGLLGGTECCDSIVHALHVREDGASSVLAAGGEFETMGGRTSSFMAEWEPLWAASRRGSVDAGAGPPADVLFVNDSAYLPTRQALFQSHEPITVFVGSPPAARGPSPFVLYGYRGRPTRGAESRQPFGIGLACAPTPLDGAGAGPAAIWNNTGRILAGVPTRPSSPAPSLVLELPAGTGRRASFFLQGIVSDPASAGSRRASVTNAILVEVR